MGKKGRYHPLTPAAESPAIRTEGLSKSFGNVAAVAGLDLEIGRGQLFGLVGPDGAGKTTLLRMLATLVEPTAGEAWIADYSVLRDPRGIREKIGYMPQRFGLYEDLTVLENVVFYADLYEVPRAERPLRIERLLGFSNLAPFRERLAGQLSGGMKQKLGLACALIHTPEILFLDEPTNGVDPVSRRDFWKILYELLREGITILVSTAYLDEAERCTTVGLMHEGRLLVKDDPAAIRKSLRMAVLELWADEPRSAAAALRGRTGVAHVSIYGNRLHVSVDPGMDADRLAAGMNAAGNGVQGVRKIVPSLEDVFLSLVEKT